MFKLEAEGYVKDTLFEDFPISDKTKPKRISIYREIPKYRITNYTGKVVNGYNETKEVKFHKVKITIEEI